MEEVVEGDLPQDPQGADIAVSLNHLSFGLN